MTKMIKKLVAGMMAIYETFPADDREKKIHYFFKIKKPRDPFGSQSFIKISLTDSSNFLTGFLIFPNC